jgi:hypothetical protein
MPLNTKKRIRKYSPKNKTRKYYGGADEQQPDEQQPDEQQPDEQQPEKKSDETEGVVDIAKDFFKEKMDNIYKYTKEKGLRLAGLKEINPTEENETPTQNGEINQNTLNNPGEENPGIISNLTSIGSTALNAINKGTANVISGVNEVIESEPLKKSASETASETANAAENLLTTFNEKLNTPEMKEQTKVALKNAADYTNIVLDAMEEPINKSIDQLNEVGTKAASGAAAGFVRVAGDVAGAIPGWGALIEAGEMLNDVTRAAKDVVEAGTEATHIASKVIEETSENINKGLETLHDKKREGINIMDRTNNSLNKFQAPYMNQNIANPMPSAQAGGVKKSRRRLFKRKGKSKRVRFAF